MKLRAGVELIASATTAQEMRTYSDCITVGILRPGQAGATNDIVWTGKKYLCRATLWQSYRPCRSYTSPGQVQLHQPWASAPEEHPCCSSLYGGEGSIHSPFFPLPCPFQEGTAPGLLLQLTQRGGLKDECRAASAQGVATV